MQVKTILNRIQRHRSFVYGPARLVQGTRLALEVEVRPRANARAKCSGCGQSAPGYDRLPARRFEFVPLWGIAVFLLYAMRRVSCTTCGVKVFRIQVAYKYAQRSIRRLRHPAGVIPMKLGRAPVPNDVVHRVIGFLTTMSNSRTSWSGGLHRT